MFTVLFTLSLHRAVNGAHIVTFAKIHARGTLNTVLVAYVIEGRENSLKYVGRVTLLSWYVIPRIIVHVM
jgi:hypothetical protein